LVVSHNGAQDAVPLQIGAPAAQGAASWRLPLLVRLGMPGDTRGFHGAIVDLGYFVGRYRDVDLGAAGRIEIVRHDGVPLAIMQGGSDGSVANL